jgi:hypothetical protein
MFRAAQDLLELTIFHIQTEACILDASCNMFSSRNSNFANRMALKTIQAAPTAQLVSLRVF